MSSEDVAKYLYEVGANQRKLDYCRQILASNTNFIAECIFNLRDPLNTNTQTKSQFLENLKTLSLGCNSQQEGLIFNYFQIDNKNYITFGQFQDLVMPQNDPALKKIVALRRKEQFVLDYSLRYALQKFFFQIIENQVKLELMCKFTFPKGDDEKKLKSKRLDDINLSQFMAAHGKFPDAKTLQYIVREMNLNKGDCKRNKLITQYIIAFNDKYKRKGQSLPQVIPKEALAITTTVRKPTSEVNKENTNKNNSSQMIDLGVKSSRNPLLLNSPLEALATPISQGKTSKVALEGLEPISEVERRISSLMSEVNSTMKNSSPIKQMYKKGSGKQQQLKSSIVESIKDELQREKNNRGGESKVGRNDKRQDHGFKTGSQLKDLYQNDRNLTDRRLQFDDIDAITDKNLTNRKLDNRSSKKVAQQNEICSTSQLIYKPTTRLESSGSPPKLGSHSAVGRFDYRVGDKNKRDARDEDPYKKRIQYLKSLIDDKAI